MVLSRGSEKDCALTIVICTFNGGTKSRRDGKSNLKLCLESLDRSNINLVIVNDGSQDDTEDIALSFAPTVYSSHQMNQGLKQSFNEAASYVKTKYMLRVDDDILFPTDPTWVTRLVAHMEKYPNCGGCGATQYLPDGRLWCVGDFILPKYHHIQTLIDEQCYRCCHSIMGCFSCYPKKVFDEVGGITCSQWMRAETEDLNMRIQQAGYEIHCLPIKFVHCHSMTSGKKGTYNDHNKANRIKEHMMTKWGIPFYDKTDVKLPFIKNVQDRYE